MKSTPHPVIPSFPNIRKIRSLTACAGIFCALGLIPAASGALLVYEGYDGYTAGSLISQSVNANATGISGTYSGSNFNANTTGLTFGTLQVEGGSATSTTAARASLSAGISSGTSATGTLWGSYLVSVSGTTGNVSTSVGGDQHFLTGAVLGGAQGRSSVSYTPSNFASASTGSSLLASGTTYLIISKRTNVGEPLSGSNAGTAQYWVLTESQFESFVAAGQTESWLTSASLGTGASNVFAGLSSASSISSGGPYLFDDTQTINLSVGFQNAANTFDELRYGTTLADVTPVPEPSTVALLMSFGAVAALGWPRKANRRLQTAR